MLWRFVLVALWLGNFGSLALTTVVTVKPYHDECFLIRTSPSWKKDQKKNPRYVWGHYELISDSLDAKPLVVYISTYNLERMLYKSGKSEPTGHFDVKLEAGEQYWLCIVNHQGGRYAAEDDDVEAHPDNRRRKVGVSFDVVTHDQFEYTDEEGNPIPPEEDSSSKAHDEAKERSSQWMVLSRRLQMKLNGMERHFDYLRVRESDHRALTEKTFSDVLSWTLAEALTVAFVAVSQIFYFRRFVERSRQYSMM